VLGDMAYLRTRCRFMALMPQWHFLNFLAEQGRRYPTFNLQMQTEVTALLEEQGEVTGIRATTPAGPVEVRSSLVVGADGRNSVVRESAGLPVDEVGAPIDVLWMRLPKREGDPEFILNADRGKILVLLDRGTYWQCGLTILKGSAENIRAADIEEFRATIVEIAPFLDDRVADFRSARLSGRTCFGSADVTAKPSFRNSVRRTISRAW
jgi:2-polyprenyl-6-methoxyphenol hydroxylase-like FAD-dependent oxidoreductase